MAMSFTPTLAFVRARGIIRFRRFIYRALIESKNPPGPPRSVNGSRLNREIRFDGFS